MRKILITMLLLNIMLLSACSKQTNANNSSEATKTEAVTKEESNIQETTDESENKIATDSSTTTRIYDSENGPIEVPVQPQKIIVLNSFLSGSVMALDGNIVGIDSWSKANPRYKEYIQDSLEVTEGDLEKIIELEPDLIIAASTTKNLDKLSEIAPTVSYTYGKVDYLTQHLEIGKLLNKESEAQAWIDDFKSRAQAAGEKIKAKIGENTTISVIESYEKQLYVFGDNWGRGTEILYQEMKLAMPEKVKETALEAGYYAMSPEVLSEYAGDYVIFSKNAEADNSFQDTQTYKNIPAVKNGRVLEVNASEFYFNDPITLDYQLSLFNDFLLGN